VVWETLKHSPRKARFLPKSKPNATNNDGRENLLVSRVQHEAVVVRSALWALKAEESIGIVSYTFWGTDAGQSNAPIALTPSPTISEATKAPDLGSNVIAFLSLVAKSSL
jgi:hypothetical protein